MRGTRLNLFQGLSDIRFDVDVILNPSRKSNEVILNADLGALFGTLIPIRNDSRLFNQRLHATERRRDVRNLQLVDKLCSRPKITLDLERYHPTETFHVLFRNFVVAVAW